MPVPFLIMLPPVPVIFPPKIVDSLFPPMVSAADPKVMLPLVVPPPEREPTAVLKHVMSTTVPAVLESTRAELLPKALATPALRVPTFTWVGPV